MFHSYIPVERGTPRSPVEVSVVDWAHKEDDTPVPWRIFMCCHSQARLLQMWPCKGSSGFARVGVPSGDRGCPAGTTER
eukprot:5436567-Amphidinium_carterae.1